MIKTQTSQNLVEILAKSPEMILPNLFPQKQLSNVKNLKSFRKEAPKFSFSGLHMDSSTNSSGYSQQSRTEDAAENFYELQPQERLNISTNEDSQPFKPKKVFVSFKDPNISVSQFRKIFQNFGKLRQAYLCKPKPVSSSSKSKKKNCRYGFVTFYDYRKAQELVSLKSIEYEGEQFKVELMKYKPEYRQKKEWKKRQKYRGSEIGGENLSKVHHTKHLKRTRKRPPSELGVECEVVASRGRNQRARFRSEIIQKWPVRVAGLRKNKECNSRPTDDEKPGIPTLKNKVRVGGVLDHKMLAKIDGRHEESYAQKFFGPVISYQNSYKLRGVTFRKMYLLPKQDSGRIEG